VCIVHENSAYKMKDLGLRLQSVMWYVPRSQSQGQQGQFQLGDRVVEAVHPETRNSASRDIVWLCPVSVLIITSVAAENSHHISLSFPSLYY
jgi:hypothetical protein